MTVSERRVHTADEMEWAKAKLREMLGRDQVRVDRAKERLAQEEERFDEKSLDDLLDDLEGQLNS